MNIEDLEDLEYVMREQVREHGRREWRELPDWLRTEHTIGYLRACDFTETLAEALVSGLYAHLAEYVSENLSRRWDRLRYEERQMDAVERGLYEQEGRRDG